MKSLILALGVLLSVSSSFAGVSVIIDGQSYSCSQGGSSGGNSCECVTMKNWDGQRWDYEYYKNGSKVNDSSGYSSEAEAETQCRRASLSDRKCFQ